MPTKVFLRLQVGMLVLCLEVELESTLHERNEIFSIRIGHYASNA